MPQPWERLQDESPAAYAAFCIYRDLGSSRSFDSAWRRHKAGADGAQRAPGNWRAWAKRFRWPERAVAYDNRLVAAEMRGRERAAEDEAEALERKRRTVTDLEYRLGIQLGVAESARIKNGDTKGAGANLEVASRLMRRALRMPTEVDEPAPADWKAALFGTSGQFADMLPPGAMPTMPEDVLAKPKIDASGTVAATGAIPAQPEKVTR